MPCIAHRINSFAGLILISYCGAQALAAQAAEIEQPTVWASRPDKDAFDRIEDERLAAAQRAIDELLAVQGPRSIKNTLAPYDRAIQQLNSASYFAAVMQAVHPDAAFRDRATQMTSKVGAAQTALSLNQAVYKALAGLDASGADAATQYYLQRLLLEFRLAGVDRDDATRGRLKALQERLTDALSAFDRNINDDVRTVEVATVGELDGLPQDFLDSHKPAANGRIRLTTNYPDLWPVLTFARSDRLRRSLWLAWTQRAYPRNQRVLLDMMRTRYEIAQLLGYSSWADYSAADKMIGNQNQIASFIADIDASSKPTAQRETALVLDAKRKDHPRATTVYDYEAWYYQERVKRARYDFDSQSLRPYFPYPAVKQGVLDTAAALFHVSFRQERDAPTWAPGVETWDLVEGGQVTGRFYLDMHPRPGKYSHAEMVQVQDGIRSRQLPEAILICNFPEPTDADPGLMVIDDVTTFLHEFGHLMHHLLGGQQAWAGISGITTEGDFGEAPSEMLEEWIHSPQVLRSFARHYQTGATVPEELITRMNRAQAFGRASWVQEQNALSAVSFDVYHTAPAQVHLDTVMGRNLRRYTQRTMSPGADHFYANFTHLGGYSSSYYTYLWDKVIAEDFFLQFDQQNLLAGDAPARYRHTVLEPGGSMPANDLIRHFLGRPVQLESFRKWMSAEFAGEP